MAEPSSILLIDDEPRLRHNLQILLQSEGYRVTTAENGAEGIQKVHEEPFDLVITDLVMPNMDGFRVLEYLRDHFPDVVVVAITAYVSPESAIEAVRRGAYDYIAKPFDFDLMHLTIKRALERAHLQKTLRHYVSESESEVEERTRELAEVNKQLEKSLADLKAAQEELVRTEKLRVLGELTGAVSRELADPLTVIISFTQLLAKKFPPEGPMKAQLEYISEAAARCYQIVQSLRNFVEAKASLSSLASRVDLSGILLEGGLDEKPSQTSRHPFELE
jgi:DNA-binding response OmpR family regulator